MCINYLTRFCEAWIILALCPNPLLACSRHFVIIVIATRDVFTANIIIADDDVPSHLHHREGGKICAVLQLRRMRKSENKQVY